MKAVHGAVRSWALQRATAVLALAFLLYFLLHLALAPPATQAEWRAWLLAPAMRVAMLLFFTAVALHAWVGVRDVILDYIKPLGLRLSALLLLALWLAGTVGWVGLSLSPAA